MSEIKGNSVLIAGFGREGKSTFNYLQKNYPETNIAVADQNPDALREVSVKTYSGDNYLAEIDEFDTVIKTPGIPPSEIFNKAKNLTSHTNIFFENCKGIVIGVTGTKGKSTTSSLIAHILQSVKPDVRLIGNVGKPALDYLESANSETIFVMELSSYQLADIHHSPHIAVVLPIYEEHLNYHGTFEKYWMAKSNIAKFQKEGDYLFYYEDNDYSKKIAELGDAQKIAFNKSSLESQLLGNANKINIEASCQVVRALGVSEEAIKKAVLSFNPLPHRLEFVGKFSGITFINDSLATIPEATIHALEALSGKVETLIAGGFDRGVSFTALGQVLAKSEIKNLILFPDTGEKIEKALPKNNLKIFHTDSMEEAVKLAYAHTSEGRTVLMSPASTSFNLFKDYEERGNAFKKFVQELENS